MQIPTLIDNVNGNILPMKGPFVAILAIMVAYISVFLSSFETYAALNQLTVQVVYLIPTDVAEPLEEEISLKRNIVTNVQRFYGKEMNKRGYGYKTFNLEKNDNNIVVIHKIKGDKTLKQYKDLKQAISEVNVALGTESINEGDNNVVRVIFIAGLTQIKINTPGINFFKCSTWRIGNKKLDKICLNHSLVAANRQTLLSFVTAHELGHAFGLNHNKDGESFLMKPRVNDNRSLDLDIVFLSDDECRWLNAHEYFNNKPNDNSFPVVTKAEKWELDTGFVRIVFNLENKNELYHSYLQRQTGAARPDFVLGWGELSANKLSIEFLIHKREFDRKNNLKLYVIDAQGNILSQDANMEFNGAPAAPSNPNLKTVVIWSRLKVDGM